VIGFFVGGCSGALGHEPGILLPRIASMAHPARTLRQGVRVARATSSPSYPGGTRPLL
jgi:hypothetical protein